MQIKFIRHFIVICSIFLSGSLLPFVFSSGYSFFLLLFTGILIFIVFVLCKTKYKINFLIFLFLIIVFLGILFFIRKDFQSVSTYFGFYFRFFIAFLLVSLIEKDFFIKSYTFFFVVYGFFSLIMFVIGVVFPEFVYRLPIMYNDAGTGYRHLYVYFYQGIDLWNFRNAGLFWEAGAFQVFLVIALIFQHFVLKKNNIKKLILILSILSTFSVIGMLIVIIFLCILFFGKKSKLIYFSPIFFILLLFSVSHISKLIEAKFTGKHSSGNERLIGQLADIKVWVDNPLFGAGLENYNKSFKNIALDLGAKIPTSTNSFTGMIALNGFLYSCIMFLALFLFIFKISESLKDKILISFIFLMLLSSQGMLNQILFLCFSFYGVQSLNIKIKEIN